MHFFMILFICCLPKRMLLQAGIHADFDRRHGQHDVPFPHDSQTGRLGCGVAVAAPANVLTPLGIFLQLSDENAPTDEVVFPNRLETEFSGSFVAHELRNAA